MDFKAVCRTCLKEATEMRSIYENDTENPLSTMITSISATTVRILANLHLRNFQEIQFFLKASELDGLPGQICIECVDILRQSVQFKQQCENAYETLKSILGVYIETTKPLNAETMENNALDAAAIESDSDNDEDNPNESIESIICGPNEKCIQTEDICFYPCEMCSLKFFKEEALKEHRASHKSKESGFKCRNCDRQYSRLSHLRRHINVAHPEVNISGKLDDIYCKQCDKHFTRHEHLRRHMVLHQEQTVKQPMLKLENDEDAIKCGECHQIFQTQNDFNQHDKCEAKIV